MTGPGGRRTMGKNEDEYLRISDSQRNAILSGMANQYGNELETYALAAGQINQQPKQQPKEPVGPDIEIEQYHRMFEADQKIHPHHAVGFEKFIEINTPARSNAWAYESNRTGTNLISF